MLPQLLVSQRPYSRWARGQKTKPKWKCGGKICEDTGEEGELGVSSVLMWGLSRFSSCSLSLFSLFFPSFLFDGFMPLKCLCITHLGASFPVINILLARLFQVLCSECVLCQLFYWHYWVLFVWEGRLFYCFPCMLIAHLLLWLCIAAWHKQKLTYLGAFSKEASLLYF